MRQKKQIVSERFIQISIFDWARHIRVPEGGYLFDYMAASANGGSRHLLEAINLKKMGVSPGFPDIGIYVPRKTHHGMFLEVKAEKNYKVSEKQEKWIEKLVKNGYYAAVGIGLNNCIDLIEGYLK